MGRAGNSVELEGRRVPPHLDPSRMKPSRAARQLRAAFRVAVTPADVNGIVCTTRSKSRE